MYISLRVYNHVKSASEKFLVLIYLPYLNPYLVKWNELVGFFHYRY